MSSRSDMSSGSGEIDDGVVPNETLIVSPVISGVERTKLEDRGDGPIAEKEAEKDLGPPDGGYGWVVVGYVPCLRADVVRSSC
jgi:hypothetical protein